MLIKFKYLLFLCVLQFSLHSAVSNKINNQQHRLLIQNVQETDTIISQLRSINRKKAYEVIQLIKAKAEAGDVKSQCIMGLLYHNGLQTQTPKNLSYAEQWLLKARDAGYVRAYIDLSELFEGIDSQKFLEYTKSAIDFGFKHLSVTLVDYYTSIHDWVNLFIWIENTLDFYKDSRSIPDFNEIYRSMSYAKALCLRDAIGCEKDIPQFINIIKELAEQKYGYAMLILAKAYLYQEFGFEKNLELGKTILLEIIKLDAKDSKNLKDLVMMQLADIYEASYDFTEAAKCYKAITNNISGKINLWKLILTKNISGDISKAFKDLENYIYNNQKPDFMAYFLYCHILMKYGYIELGLEILETINEKGEFCPCPVVYIQLAIAYKYGFGVDIDKEKSKEYSDKIDMYAEKFRKLRSWNLAQGVRHLLGLGIESDIDKGLKLINLSHEKFDDVQFLDEDIFPFIELIKYNKPISIASGELINAYIKERSPRAKTATNAKLGHKKTKSNILNAKDWNNKFHVSDESIVSDINLEKKLIIINDPKRKEQLTINFSELPTKNLKQIKTIRYADRIDRRKRQSPLAHDFAEMLDYIIQYVGDDSEPFVIFGRQDKQLLLDVIRKNLETGEEKHCIAEYTFHKDENGEYLHHRLLRPLKKLEVN